MNENTFPLHTVYKDGIENSSCSFSRAAFCLCVHIVIIVEPVFRLKKGDINGGFVTSYVTRLGLKMSLTSYGGRHRTVRKKISGMDVINELRCTATSSFFVSPCTCPVCQTGLVQPLSCSFLLYYSVFMGIYCKDYLDPLNVYQLDYVRYFEFDILLSVFISWTSVRKGTQEKSTMVAI